MNHKTLGILIMIVSIFLFISSLFNLQATKFGFTSMTFEHSLILLCIGWLIIEIPQKRK